MQAFFSLDSLPPELKAQLKQMLADPALRQRASPALVAAVSLLYDTSNKLGFKFTPLDVDPDYPGILRVRAERATASSKPLTLLVVVMSDPSAGDDMRIDENLTLDCADPRLLLWREGSPENNSGLTERQSSLRRLGMACLEYQQDHDEHFPDAATWVDGLMPYVKDAAVFRDPFAPMSEKWSYAYNQNLSGKGIGDVDNPALTVMFFECASGVKNASDTGQSVPVHGRDKGGTDYCLVIGIVQRFPDGTKPSFLLSGK